MHGKLNRRTLGKTAGALASSAAMGNAAAAAARDATPPGAQAHPQPGFGVTQLPEGYQIEKVVEGLTYPTGLAWDDQGQVYVAEAGGAFLDLSVPSRILQIANGQATEIANLTQPGPIRRTADRRRLARRAAA